MNARTFIKSHQYGLSDLIARGVDINKVLNEDQQEIVSDILSATNDKMEVANMRGYEETLLAMQIMIFINTL